MTWPSRRSRASTPASARLPAQAGPFKDVRDRLLKSACDFYGKLGALLGKESDLAFAAALVQANSSWPS